MFSSAFVGIEKSASRTERSWVIVQEYITSHEEEEVVCDSAVDETTMNSFQTTKHLKIDSG